MKGPFRFLGVTAVLLAALVATSMVTTPALAVGVFPRASSAAFEKKVELSLAGSNGYRVTVSGEPLKGLRDQVMVSAESANGSVTYFVPGHVSETSMRANLGSRGVIRLQYHPRGKAPLKDVPERCFSGGSSESRTRAITPPHGIVRFTGEGGFTSVIAHRARGVIHEKLTCGEPRQTHSRDRSHYPLLAADSKDGPLFLSGRQLSASSPTGSPPAEQVGFVALDFQRDRQIQIFRVAGAIGPSSDFTYDSALTSATVTPPAPFSGSAQFERLPDGTTNWTGSLSVEFPGGGPVALTGFPFTATLELEHTSPNSPLLQFRRRLLQPALLPARVRP
jgi:hypothetical protein